MKSYEFLGCGAAGGRVERLSISGIMTWANFVSRVLRILGIRSPASLISNAAKSHSSASVAGRRADTPFRVLGSYGRLPGCETDPYVNARRYGRPR